MLSLKALAQLVLLAVLPIFAESKWNYFANENAVNGCGLACTDNGVYKCVGTFSSWPSCQAASSSSAYHIATWSPGTGNCWVRTDNSWDTISVPGDEAGCDDAFVANCAPAPAWNGTNITVFVDTSTVLGYTHALSPAVTLDFWRHDDPTFGIKWANSSAQEIDLDNPILKALTASLAPGLIRLGGSPEDSLIFDNDGTCVPQSGGNGPAQDYYCSQVKPYSYDCLTPARWEALLAFGVSTGMKIVLGLNGCYGRMSAHTSMDMSNAKAIMQAAAASPNVAALWGFELSNEVVPNTIEPHIYGVDVAAVKQAATDIFSSAGLPVPMVAGPDQGGCIALGDVAATTPAGVLYALTYHQYPQCTAPSNGLVLDWKCLQGLDAQATACAVASLGAQGKAPAVWAGETADHSGGGVLNLTDTFRSSFYYAWQMGALPINGVELGARQCLSGGDYELLQRGSFTPNPDFFILSLFKATVGGSAAAYEVTQSVFYNESGIRVFAFSASSTSAGSTTLMVINLQGVTSAGVPASPVSLLLTGPMSLRPRMEWHLTGDPAAQHGPVYCNNATLGLDPVTHLPPSWAGLGLQANGPLVTAPSTITFATIM